MHTKEGDHVALGRKLDATVGLEIVLRTHSDLELTELGDHLARNTLCARFLAREIR